MQLIQYEKAKQAVALLMTVDEVKEMIDKAAAATVYAQRAQDMQMEINAREYRIRCERRLGEILSEIPKASNQNRKAAGVKNTPAETLEDRGIDKNLAKSARAAAAIPEPEFETLLTEHREKGKPVRLKDLLKRTHVSQAVGENEWYTPAEFIEISRGVMGDIDLDPASSDLAQVVVRAKKYYTIADDGLSKKWRGRVWMNPPYSKDLISKFAGKLLTHVESGEVEQAIVLVNNATETAWFQPLARASSAICFPSGRIRFTDKFGKTANSPLQGQTLLYFGAFSTRFCDAFCNIGVVFTASSTGAVIDAA